MTSNPVLNAAEQLRDALYVTMAECDAKPCRISLSPSSETPIDVCCDCGDGDGQAWVSIIGAKPLDSRMAGYAPCAIETEVLYVVGVARCAAKQDRRGNPPSAEQLDADTQKLMRDFQIMRKAFLGTFVSELGLDKQMYRLGDYDVHPVRDCMVATHEFYVTFDNIPF